MTDSNYRQQLAELVHEKSVEILQEVGFCAPEPSLLKRLDSAGFNVDFESSMVRISPELLDEALKTLPKPMKLYSREGGESSPFDAGTCFMGAGTPVNVFDLEAGVQRSSTRRDVRQLVAIQHALSQIVMVVLTVTATDYGDYSDLVEIVELLRHTTKPVVHRTLFPEHIDAAVEMLFSLAGDEEAFHARPFFATLYCPISPGYFTPGNIRSMVRWAENRIPITILSMAMGGASAPATLLGELIVINTDILAWITALQILFPGTPLLYGSVSAVLDMRTGLLPLGAPERGIVNAGGAIMGHYYEIPSMCGGLSADAKELDAQAGFEKVTTAVPLLQEKATIIYGVGATDAGSTISYTQMVFDDEIIAGLRRMMEGIDLHDPAEEVELIKSLTPRGNFMTAQHTRRNFRQHWLPNIISRDTYATWLEKGESIESICRQKAQEIIARHQPPPLATGLDMQLEAIMDRHVPGFRFDSLD